MTAYFIRRSASALLVLWLVSLVVFMIIRSLPGDALLVKVGEIGRLPPDQLEAARHKMGLDKSKPEQYLSWIAGLPRGDLGESLIWDGQSVTSRLEKALPVSIENAILASIVALVVAVPVGVISAVK